MTGVLTRIEIDPASLPCRGGRAAHDRQIALADLLHANVFTPVDGPGGGYHLTLGIHDNRLLWRVGHDSGWARDYLTAASTLTRIIRDYGIICTSYIEAAHQFTPSQLEAIDMGRRGLHNEGAEAVINRLNGKVVLDFDTARRLFTLLFAVMGR